MYEFVPKSIKRMAARYLGRLGFIPVSAGPPSLDTVMKRRRDLQAATVIDVGASDGRWSERMMKYLPKAKYLLVEAQQAAHGEKLEHFVASHPNAEYVLCAAGDQQGEIEFDASDPFGGLASTTPFSRDNVRVPMQSIDHLVEERNLRGPFLLKLDTHGFEVPILEGARKTLDESVMLVIEAYNFTLCPGALRFHELCFFLESRGFRCADMFDLMVRPLDDAFWQMDLVFLPSGHPIFQSNHFRDERKSES
jgi:FkbM family methyltransferase